MSPGGGMGNSARVRLVNSQLLRVLRPGGHTDQENSVKASRVDQAKFLMINITDSSGFCIKIPKLKERVHFAKQKYDETT